jgi:hypothetical protein
MLRRFLKKLLHRLRPAQAESLKTQPAPKAASSSATLKPASTVPIEATKPTPQVAPPQADPPKPAPQAATEASPDEEKIKKHREKTRAALLKHLAEKGGSLSLAELHDFSERRYFVAHRAFSTLMEELVEDEAISWDPQAGIVTLRT